MLCLKRCAIVSSLEMRQETPMDFGSLFSGLTGAKCEREETAEIAVFVTLESGK